MPGTDQLLRIATYNVHSCIGTDGRHDPDRTASVIAELDADAVALQEFRYPADIALETSTPVVLTSLERYAFTLGPTRAHDNDSFGNVLLTRHPIRDVTRVDLSRRRREPRGALAATVDFDGVEVHLVCTHLGLRLAERRFQVRQLLEHVEARSPSSFVVLGDFNDWLPGRSVAHVLDERFGPAVRCRSFPSRWPFLSLDRIWVHPSRAVREVHVHCSPLARTASDHLPVVAILAMPGSLDTNAASARREPVAGGRS